MQFHDYDVVYNIPSIYTCMLMFPFISHKKFDVGVHVVIECIFATCIFTKSNENEASERIKRERERARNEKW